MRAWTRRAQEDLGLTVAAIALVVVLRSRRSSPRTALCALAVAVLGVTATLVTLTLVVPAFNTSGGYDYWSKVDDGFALFDGVGSKLRTLAWLLIPTSGLLACVPRCSPSPCRPWAGGSSPRIRSSGSPSSTRSPVRV